MPKLSGSEEPYARFPPSIWNIHLHTIRRDHSTNILCEDGRTNSSDLLGIHTLPRRAAFLHCRRTKSVPGQFEMGREEPGQHSHVFSTMDAIFQQLCIRYRNGETSRLNFLPSYYKLQLFCTLARTVRKYLGSNTKNRG